MNCKMLFILKGCRVSKNKEKHCLHNFFGQIRRKVWRINSQVRRGKYTLATKTVADKTVEGVLGAILRFS